jgi:hypothetical protein
MKKRYTNVFCRILMFHVDPLLSSGGGETVFDIGDFLG